MREPAPDYASHQYERPNQPWACGLASDGHTCPAGPTARGACPALAECVPARDGDRWKCNRSTLRGGVCGEGPTPEGGCGCVHRCRPVRSLRSIRGRFVTACTLLAIGGFFILLSGNWRNQAISPGPLARQHAQLLENGASDPNCAACHAAAERSVAGWTGSLVGFHGSGTDQSQRCMKCHNATISKEFAMVAHNVAPELMRRITGLESKVSSATHDLACATCHREHQGTQLNLTAMNDAACQSCHRQRYESFSTNHPEFGRWPYERRTRIVFNHASHRAKHFAEKKQTFDCKSCHLEDSTGSAQLLASYENTCASCHAEKIATSVAKGVPMFALPTLDVDALKAAGHDIGAWPEEASGDFDGQLPPVMKLLLAADPAAAKAMRTLGPDFEFFDVDPDDAAQLEACAALALAIKRLFASLDESTLTTLRERLNAALDRNVPDSQLNRLLTGLPEEMIRSATAAWLPGAEGDHRSTPDDALPASSMPTLLGGEGMRFDPVGTWTRDDATLSILYQPAAHADPVLAGWLDVFTTQSEPAGLSRRDKPGGSPEHTLFRAAISKELSSPTAPGLCASCHSTERAGDGQLSINWRASNRGNESRSLTKFSHGPHVLLPQLADCTSCHAINDAADTATSYATEDPHAFVSDFSPLTKQHCVQCHTAKAAGDSCQKCHNYHVDIVESWRLRSIVK